MIQLLPIGNRAVIVTGMTDPTAWASALGKHLAARGSDAVFMIPAAETVLVACASATALAQLSPMIHSVPASVTSPTAPAVLVEIPVVYDGEDLSEIAQKTGLSPAQVAALHSEASYTVAFCGFAPGFAYLRGLPSMLQLPRRLTPRAQVPAGAVAVASEYTAVYPTASPGGWNLLGTTSVTLFDGSADEPALLHPGDRVRFVPVSSLLERPTGRPRPHAWGQQAFTVTAPGIASSIQDGGRSGHGDIGVSPSGMVDPLLGGAINRFVGNRPDAALIETCGGVAIRADHTLIVSSSETLAPSVVPAGKTFHVAGGSGRRWHYLAIRGGILAEQALGSSSTDTLSGLGPPPLTAGQTFAVGPDTGGLVADVAPVPTMRRNVRISVGPRLDWFASDAFAILTAGEYAVTQSSRVGVRLVGPRLSRVQHGELPSEGLVRGAIQVVPSGELVMMLSDHPTTGGYPVVAVVHPDDVATVAQLDVVTFVTNG